MLQALSGLGFSAGIRVGNVLGAGNKQAAILATKVSTGFAGVCMWCFCVSHLPLNGKHCLSCGNYWIESWNYFKMQSTLLPIIVHYWKEWMHTGHTVPVLQLCWAQSSSFCSLAWRIIFLTFSPVTGRQSSTLKGLGSKSLMLHYQNVQLRKAIFISHSDVVDLASALLPLVSGRCFFMAFAVSSFWLLIYNFWIKFYSTGYMWKIIGTEIKKEQTKERKFQ